MEYIFYIDYIYHTLHRYSFSLFTLGVAKTHANMAQQIC